MALFLGVDGKMRRSRGKRTSYFARYRIASSLGTVVRRLRAWQPRSFPPHALQLVNFTHPLSEVVTLQQAWPCESCWSFLRILAGQIRCKTFSDSSDNDGE